VAKKLQNIQISFQADSNILNHMDM